MYTLEQARHLVELKQLPDENVELLCEVDLLNRGGEVGLVEGGRGVC